jgi:SAM-dependent methyltransferase
MFNSISENRGIAALTPHDLKVYSVGISTGGSAEIRMAEQNSRRHIVATTIDPEGIRFARQRIEEKKLSNQIEVKLENVTTPLPYENGWFDFIYARLILHYLPKNQLENALKELHRILNVRGRMFIVVRSTDCPKANCKTSTLDPTTGLTTYKDNHGISYTRYFHSEESMTNYLLKADFQPYRIKNYQEQICVDFQRTQLSTHVDSLLEVLALKQC